MEQDPEQEQEQDPEQNNTKKIIINDTSVKTNKQSKHINYKKEQKPRVETFTWDITEQQLEATFQYDLLKTLFETVQLTNNTNTTVLTKIHKLIREHIKSKISSYKQQDINKKRLNHLEFIHYNDVISLLTNCELHCHYCAHDVYLLYTFVRETKQWTLDRINNDIGHNKGNLVVACLECNLKRRRTNKDAFMFTKNMKIIREGI